MAKKNMGCGPTGSDAKTPSTGAQNDLEGLGVR